VNNTILFGKTPLKAQNDYFLKIWGHGPFAPPPGYAYDPDFQRQIELCLSYFTKMSLKAYI